MKIRVDRVSIIFDNYRLSKKDYGYGKVEIVELINNGIVIAELGEYHCDFLKRKEVTK